MAMKSSETSERLLVKTVDWIWVSLFTLLMGCSSVDNGPLVSTPNEFIEELKIESVANGNTTPLADEVECQVNTGVIVQVCLDPSESLPEMYSNRKVVPYQGWGMQLVVYPAGTSSTGPSAQVSGVPPLPSPRAKFTKRVQINGWYSPHWSDCGFLEIKPLKSPVTPSAIAKWNKGEGWWFWTYLCAGKDHIGEYTYEFQLLPTAAPISSVRFENGDPVVLKRGTLKVVKP